MFYQMSSFPVICHLPLITPRIELKFNVLPLPPQITSRRDLGAVIRRQGRHAARQAATPYSQPKPRNEDRPTFNSRSESPLSDLSDLESSDPEDLASTSRLIQKPVGEAGRSKSGGYNLEAALGWDKTAFNNFVVGFN